MKQCLLRHSARNFPFCRSNPISVGGGLPYYLRETSKVAFDMRELWQSSAIAIPSRLLNDKRNVRLSIARCFDEDISVPEVGGGGIIGNFYYEIG